MLVLERVAKEQGRTMLVSLQEGCAVIRRKIDTKIPFEDVGHGDWKPG